MKDALLTRLRGLSERQLYDELYRDPLTQCLNRRAFEQLQPSPIAIIDLDSLKYLNDTLGHRYGDGFLVGLAVALTKEFGWEDVYRLSGDEFLVVNGSANSLQARLKALQATVPTFSFGAGETLALADDWLNENKQHREDTGLRAPCGVEPPWFHTYKTGDAA